MIPLQAKIVGPNEVTGLSASQPQVLQFTTLFSWAKASFDKMSGNH
jgi:hypothetical protein